MKIEKPYRFTYETLKEVVTELIDAHNADEDKDAAVKKQEPVQDREWTAEEREAAEHPRVGDKYRRDCSGIILTITRVENGLLYYNRSDCGNSELSCKIYCWPSRISDDPRDRLVSRGPEPKPETNPLRDGDVVVGLGCGTFIISEQNRGIAIHEYKESLYSKPLFNFLDLAAAVRDGQKILTLTKEEMSSITNHYTERACPHRASANAKLRKAMEKP